MDPNVRTNELREKIASADLPSDVAERVANELARFDLLIKSSNLFLEAERVASYIELVTELPWNKYNQDTLDLNRAKEVLEKHHHGMELVKEKILEYLSMLILNARKNQHLHSTSLAFVGLVGSGKTSLAYSIAEVLSRPIVRIPFGGLGSAAQLRGESRIKPDSEPGLIIKALRRAKVKNPVILLDELDRVASEARTDIMGVLVELLDPEQNSAFLDHYLDLPFDLSSVLFIATANNTNNIATAVIDRLELVEMPFYSDEQKVVIGRDYLLPEALRNVGLDEHLVTVDPNLWMEIVRPLGFEGGIRSLKRTIEGIARKIARQVVEGHPGPYRLTHDNIGPYLNK